MSQTGRWLGPEAIPNLVRPLYPEGYREGTFAALLVDYGASGVRLTSRLGFRSKR